MKLKVIIPIALGIALIVYLISHIGFADVFSSVTAIGWAGFLLFCAIGLANFALLGLSWFVLVPKLPLARVPVFIWGRLIRDSSSEILPFSQVGGFVFGARALVLHRVSGATATASTIVDVTTELVAQLAFIALGLVMLTTRAPDTPFKTNMTLAMGIGLGLAALAAGGFLVAQRHGLEFLERMTARFLPKALEQTGAVKRAINGIHGSLGRLGLSVALHLASWIAGASATYVALRLMGTHIEFGAALAIEGLLSAVRSAAFAIPSAVGVQELTYAMLVPLFGLQPSVGLALSLIKRGRDILIGAPALLAWQVLEGHRQLALNNAAAKPLGDQ